MKPLTLLFWLVALPLMAATYYVDIGTGLDSNPGTQANPWAHLPASTNLTGMSGTGGWVVLQNGDTVYVKGGTVNPLHLYQDTVNNPWYNGAAATYDSIKIISGDQVGFGTGKAIMDMADVYTSCFWFQSAVGITIDGFEIRNIKFGAVGTGFSGTGGNACVNIGSGCSYMKIRKCYMHESHRDPNVNIDDQGYGIETQSPAHHLIFELNQVGPIINRKGIEPVEGTSFCIIRSNLVINCADHNITVSGNRCDTYNNLVILQGSYLHQPTFGIKVTGSSNDFWNNIVYEITSNLVSSNGNAHAATGMGIAQALDGTGGQYNRFINNSIYLMYDPGNFGADGEGIVVGISSSPITNTLFANNLSLLATNSAGSHQVFYQNNSSGCDFKFNDLFGGSGVTLIAEYGGQSGPASETVSALELSINQVPNGSASGNLNVDPVLTGGTLPSALDPTSFLPNTSFFALTVNSPASVKFGGNTYSGTSDHGYDSTATKFNNDMIGNVRGNWSIGAYEFGGQPPHPGAPTIQIGVGTTLGNGVKSL